MHNAFVFDKCVLLIPQVCHTTFMYLYNVSKPTKLSLFRYVKDGDAGEFKRLVKKDKTSTTAHNLKLRLTTLFQSICEIMPKYENLNGSTNRHLPFWFSKENILNEYIKDMESRVKGEKFVP